MVFFDYFSLHVHSVKIYIDYINILALYRMEYRAGIYNFKLNIIMTLLQYKASTVYMNKREKGRRKNWKEIPQ